MFHVPCFVFRVSFLFFRLPAGVGNWDRWDRGHGGEQHSKGHLDSKDPASVASFLRAQADRLDKTEVGVGCGMKLHSMHACSSVACVFIICFFVFCF